MTVINPELPPEPNRDRLYTLIGLIVVLGGFLMSWGWWQTQHPPLSLRSQNQLLSSPLTTSPLPSPTIVISSPPSAFQLTGGSHTFQTFNNCGPASLSMALSFYDIIVSQQTLGQRLRPYQVTNGDNDDKSVTLPELAGLAPDYNLVAYHRPNGSIDKLKQFIAQGFPVVTRTLLTPSEDIGHYRVIYGYDDSTQQLWQNDSLQGKNLAYSYEDFLELWSSYGYEYLVFVPADKIEVAEAILGNEVDVATSWQNSLARLNQELANDPNNLNLRLSRSVAYYHTGQYQAAIDEFEAIENQLPFRALWYQIEPLLAYQKLGRYDDVLPRINTILTNQNRAFSELYQLRGEIYLVQGRQDLAKREFELAIRYNRYYQPAQLALEKLL